MSMTKAERADLSSLIKKREKLMKAAAAERAARMMADFEMQSAKIYAFNDDEIWRKATLAAEKAVSDAQAKIAERCAELNIPPEFAPGIFFQWYGRGENAVSSRQAELRRAAKAKIDAIEREACTRIERMSFEAQAELLSNGLENEAAKAFLASLTTVEAMMPSLNVEDVQALADLRRKGHDHG